MEHSALFVAFAQPTAREIEMLNKSYWGRGLISLVLGIVAASQRMI